MRSGLFPGQQEALRQRMSELREEGRRRARRRLLLGLGVGVVAGALGGGWAGRQLARGLDTGDRPARSRDLRLARRAEQPLDQLLEGAGTFLVDVAQTRSCDEATWLGVARIAAAVADGRVEPRQARKLRILLGSLAERRDAPAFVRRRLEALRRR